MAAPQETNLKPIAREEPSPCARKCALTPSPIYHPDFSAREDEIVLQSSEGTLYRVHEYTLRTTSGLFKSMLSLPPPPGGHSPEPIAIHEPDAVVEPLLRLICGLATPTWTSLASLSAVLTLAENWTAPGPIALLRPALTSPKFLTTSPLHVYALATHLNFRAEAQLASTHTLHLNLFDTQHAEVLESMPACAVLPLLRLHRARRDGLKALLDSPERFLAGNGQPFHCSACAITPLDNSSWRALKHRVLREFDVCAGGDALGAGFWDKREEGKGRSGMGTWEEAKACWAAVCVRRECAAANYDRAATIKQMRACVDGLPTMVEVDWMQEEGEGGWD
ncbi:hypothetical protein C8R47DRAFT_1147237 [Mycena vitilis]|nr:hypothetical protein C8R47DRAFT_1147237 [Mycena vitilis]